MELRQLHFFVTLAEELHFGRAAERVHIAQPAFSEQIRRLEFELGARLFDRTSHYVRLTQAGALFLDEVNPALAQVQHAAAVASRAGRGVLGSIRVGINGAAANELAPLILRRFAEAHPAVGVELREFVFADPSAGLIARESDVAFLRTPVEDASCLAFTPLFVEPRVAVMASDHRLAGSASVEVSELLRGPFVFGPRPTGVIEGHPFGPHANTTEEWLSLIAAGRGVSLTPASTERFHRRPGICFIPAAGAEPSALVVAHRNDAAGPAVEAFVDAAQAVARESRR